MAAEQESYLAVLRASYDYEPQPDAQDEIPIKENQLLLLLERIDDDWWKVKVKSEDEGPAGLVPAAYVEPAEPIQVVKVLYDYEAAQPTELTVKEEEILNVYDKDDDWLLVASQSDEGRIGYVPGNYVEEVSGDGEASPPAAAAATSFSSIVVPDSPPKPARPVSTYVDPADRVAATANKAQADSIQTWAISEVDAKGKKKKGTLGIGNGAMFFASESDKNPVRKWQTSDIQSVRLEKSKHVHIDVGGPEPANLHFHAGGKDTAEAIMAKLESSRAIASEGANGHVPAVSPPRASPPVAEPIERPRSSGQKSVHFAQEEPEEIPPSQTYVEDEQEEEEDAHVGPAAAAEEPQEDGETAVVLYDFTADGEDELTVHEGETLLVLEKDSEEWWKCRNAAGAEGVVPASYVELVGGGATSPAPSSQAAAQQAAAAAAAAERAAKEAAAREEAERRAAEEREKERKRREAEQKAKAAAAAAEEDRKRREREREKQKEKEKERAAAEEEVKRKKEAERAAAAEASSSKKPRNSESQSRSSSDSKRGPPPENLRVWHDRTGQFRVDAAFLGYANGKLRLHKVNGVVIEVPAEKMSQEDLRYVEKITQQKTSPSPRKSDDDDNQPLAERRQSLLPAARTNTAAAKPPQKKGSTIDWFEFFLNAGCDVDDCTRYASSFERDKIDESILPDITESTMRSLGLREGDIIRVKKAIEQRKPKPDPKEEQLRKDEELARQLQTAEENGTNLKTRSPAPNLFSGPNGELKANMRRGRPKPSTTLPATVDLQAISTASDQIKRGTSPMIGSPDGAQQSDPGPAPLPPKSSAAPPAVSGFDDDAWTNRPSSTKPSTTTSPAAAPRAPSAPPAQPAPAAPPAPSQPAAPTVTISPPPARAASVASGAPSQQPQQQTTAKTTESDIFEQLARLSQLRVNSPAAPQPMAAAQTPPRAPSVTISTPVGFQSGLGMGSSPVPMGQALQAQQTGLLPSASPVNGPRGPFAPVPANQSLLQPLVPTTTGFSGFVPTRPSTAPSPFQPAPQPQPSLLPQPTGFPGTGPSLVPQQTGFPMQGSLMSQPTGMPTGNFGGLGGGMPSFQPTTGFNPMQSNPTGFNPIQSNPTGFNPGFGQSPFGSGSYSVQSPPPPPPPPAPSRPPVDTNPANVFAQMKSGTFAADDSAPQPQDKYDALRPNPTPLTVQPTGWGGFGGMNGYQGAGYGYQR
ncbi:hypothetical protein BD414DRAFT_474538 [Trametes punicea]|nr:hypothetical protein BD414DRAFT_474538 [Trametes punicea]